MTEDQLRNKIDQKFTDQFFAATEGRNDLRRGAILALLHSAEAESYRRGQIDALQGVHDHWRQTYQSEKVQDRVEQKLAELATSAQDDGGKDEA